MDDSRIAPFPKELLWSSHLEFDGPIFNLTQQVDGVHDSVSTTGNMIQISGEIQVRPGEEKSKSSIDVAFKMFVAEDYPQTKVVVSTMDQDDSNLIIRTPKQLESQAVSDATEGPLCLRIYATIWVASGAVFEIFNITSESLAVTFHPDLNFSTSYTNITTGSGDTKMSFEPMTDFFSREITINAGTGSVTGAYPLYDVLSITASSGNIDITVLPQSASPNRVQPADLRLTAGSGSVKTTVSTESVPNRNYTNFISSISGGVNAKLLHGNSTTIHTGSAAIDADIHPFGFNGSRTIIDTRSQSGAVDLTVNPSLSNPLDIFDQMSTNHRAYSGTLFLDS